MQKILYAALALGLVLAAAPIASADEYSFSYVDSGHGITLTGDLTTDASNNILSISNATYTDTETRINGAATLDTNASDLSETLANNVFYPAGNPYLDDHGILLQVGGGYVNLFSRVSYVVYEYTDAADLAPPGDYLLAVGGAFTATDITTLSPAATPEPSSWLLLGTGLLALMGLASRNFGASNR
jgi:hypothetical protein